MIMISKWKKNLHSISAWEGGQNTHLTLILLLFQTNREFYVLIGGLEIYMDCQLVAIFKEVLK